MMRMRAALFGLALAGLVGCSEAPPPVAPFTTDHSFAGGGYPLGDVGPTGAQVRFIDAGRFGIGIVLVNRSHRAVTVVDVRTPEPPRSLVHRLGTRLVLWNPPPCPRNSSCPATTFFRGGTTYGAIRPRAVTAGPGKSVGAQLNYRLDTCRAVAFDTTASARTVEIDYRVGSGSIRTQTLPIGSARVLLHRPAGVECLPRPLSHIGLAGSFTTTPGHLPMPGSTGDTCTRVEGGLHFRSRMFFDRDGTAFRIELLLRPGRAEAVAVGGFGLNSWTVLHDRSARITVAQRTRSSVQGRFHAVFEGHRRFFSAYGVWRCAILPR